MRFIWTVVFAALLIVIVYLTVAGIADGYFGADLYPDRWAPESWSAPDSWSEWRDIVVVVLGALLALAILVGVVLLVAAVAFLFLLRRVVREHLVPALDSLKATLDEVRGTVEFTGETVVSPIIRVYSVYRGVRRGLRAVRRFPESVRRRRGRR